MRSQHAVGVAREAWTLRDRYAAWRDRLFTSPRFQRWALALPLTRPVARRHTRALFDLCAGFTYTQVLAACVRLRLLEALADGPQSFAALGAAVGLQPAALERLAHAATALALVERRSGERLGLGSLGALLLGNPAVAELVEHHALLYADLADPVLLLRSVQPATRLRRYWAYAAHDAVADLCAADTKPYSRLMAVSQELIAADIAASYPIARHRRWLDIGGGEGAFLAALAARRPELRGVLFDVPPVAAAAREHFAARGLAPRLEAIGGDMFAARLPTGFDAAALVRVLHDHDDARALRVLRAARAALVPGGTLLIAEPLATETRADRVAEAYFGLYLWALGQGRLRTRAELARLLLDAGFEAPTLYRNQNPLLVRVLAARAARDDSKLILTT